MTIKSWPIQERPREKLLLQGAQSLSDAELLAIFLRIGTKGKTAVDLARDLLCEHHNLRKLLDLPKQHFCRQRGLGEVKYAQLQAALEMGRRYLQAYLQTSDALDHPNVIRDYLASQLRHRQQEVFSCLFLNAQNQIICFEVLFYGTLTCTSVYPREVVKKALEHNAAGVILAHNHPSGTSYPSQDDQRVTQCLIKALKLIDVEVLDHLIIGDAHVASFLELGLM